jgi:hypothetical protein
MIIFGLSVFWFGAAETGVFHCPRCGGDRHYKLKVGRRWFTLFFLPVIPLNEVARAVECQTCKGKFETAVLHIPTAGQIGSALPLIYRTFIVAVLRVGDSPAAREFAIRTIGSVGAQQYGMQQLENDLATLAPRLDDQTYHVVQQFDGNGREQIMLAGARVAMVDGPLTDDERKILTSIGEYLGLSMATIHGTLSLVAQETRHSS